MGAKKTVTKQTESNKEILRTSGEKKRIGDQIYQGGRQAALVSAKRDDSGLYRGRASADAAQMFAKPVSQVHAKASSTGKGLGSVLKVGSAMDKGTASALSEGTKRGVLSRDTNIANMINLGIGAQAQSSRAMTALSQAEFQRAKASAEIAANEANNMRGAAWGMASLGAGKFMEGKNDALDQDNRDKFYRMNQRRENVGEKKLAFSDWAQSTLGKAGGYKDQHDSWGYNMMNRFSGGG